MVFEVVAVEIRQYALKLLMADVFGCEWEETMWGWPVLLLYYDSYRWCNTKHPARFECFYDSLPPMPARVSKPISCFSLSFLFFFAVRPVHVGVIVSASLPCICFLIWPPVAVNIIYFLVHAMDGLGGGAIVKALVSSLLHSYWSTTLEYPCLLEASKILTVFRILLDAMVNNGISNYFNIPSLK